VQVIPLLDAHDKPLGTKILFVDVTRQHDLQTELQHSRQDLETAYEELQSTNEELETTNEELQSTVEELETTNEELQSTNEELETMNQELQSTNEEMEAVNQELRSRGLDLARTNVFFKGVLRSVPLAVIVLNEEMHVEFWNDVAQDMWGLRQEEVQGKHFLGLDIGLPLEQLRQPLLTLRTSSDQPIEAVVQGNNRRGKPIVVRVVCAHAGGAAHGGRGIIVVMQGVDGSGPPPSVTH
jgi:two-component system CheB/CheR fusion protein